MDKHRTSFIYYIKATYTHKKIELIGLKSALKEFPMTKAEVKACDNLKF